MQRLGIAYKKPPQPVFVDMGGFGAEARERLIGRSHSHQDSRDAHSNGDARSHL